MAYTFNTGNPVGPNGSADARDLVDNAQVADRLITSTELTVPDRLGVQRRTWAGIQQAVVNYVNRGEWVTATAYQINDIWRDGPTGAFYLVLADYTSGASAAADIAGGNVVVHQPKDWVVSVATIADLRALEPAFDGQQVELLGHTVAGLGGGIFYASFSGSAADDNGVIVVTAGGKRWRRKLSGRASIEHFGAVPGSDSSAAIRAAINYGPCRIPEKKYLYDGAVIYKDNVDILGDKKPEVNEARTQLINGSIIVGKLRIAGKNPSVKNFGVDTGIVEFPLAGTDSDAFAIGNPNPAVYSIANVNGVVGLCREVESPFHAVLVEGYYDCEITNSIGVKGLFGLAVKNTRNNISDFISIDNGSDGVIVKSDTAGGSAKRVNISNVIVDGAGYSGSETTGSGIRIMSFDTDVEEVNIVNASVQGAQYGIFVDATVSSAAGAILSLNIQNTNIKDCDVGIVASAADSVSGTIYDMKVSNVSVLESGTRAASIAGRVNSLKIDNFYGSVYSSVSDIDKAFRVGADVKSVFIDNFELVQDRNWLTPATLSLENTSASNKLGNVRCLLAGVGVPSPGFSQTTDTGTGITLSPVFDSSHWSSFIRTNQTSSTTVSTILRELSPGRRFPFNYRLIICNSGTGTMTINHNPAGWIFNRAAANVVLQPNEAIEYVFMDAVWHQVS